MQNVTTARNWAAEQFKKAGVELPSLSADLLLGFVLQWDRVRVLSHPEAVLQEETWSRFQNLIARHIAGEPVQYLTGEQEFYGLAFRVTPAVLIPRPETEMLVEKALDLIKARSSRKVRFADVGAGSGCIAVTVAHEIPQATGWAIDISFEALRVASENANRHGISDRIQFVQADLLECFSPVPSFDFVLSNPPYVALTECDNLPVSVRSYEPHPALFGGPSGLDFYRRLIPQVISRLMPEGYVLVEVGIGQAKQVEELFKRAGISLKTTVNDLRSIPRCIVGQKLSGRSHG